MRENALLERCCTVGKPVFPELEARGAVKDVVGFRSNTEPIKDGLLFDIVGQMMVGH